MHYFGNMEDEAVLIIGIISACIPWFGWFFIVCRQYKLFLHFTHDEKTEYDLETPLNSGNVKNGEYEVRGAIIKVMRLQLSD